MAKDLFLGVHFEKGQLHKPKDGYSGPDPQHPQVLTEITDYPAFLRMVDNGEARRIGAIYETSHAIASGDVFPAQTCYVIYLGGTAYQFCV